MANVRMQRLVPGGHQTASRLRPDEPTNQHSVMI